MILLDKDKDIMKTSLAWSKRFYASLKDKDKDIMLVSEGVSHLRAVMFKLDPFYRNSV